MKNKESIKHVYDEIHAPDALFGKVMNMNKKEAKMRNIIKYAVGTAAAFALTMIASNGVCYAATGETWISKALVYINGDVSEQEITWHQSGDTFYGELNVPSTNSEETDLEMFSFESDTELTEEVFIMTKDASAPDTLTESTCTEDVFTAELIRENDKIFLITPEERIDITEDFLDGEATGTFQFSGLTLTYTITGTIENCDLKITCE